MYSLASIDNKEISKAKGVNKKIRHNEYVECLFNEKVVRHNMKRIQSKLHEIGTYDVFKISLSCLDDKRYLLDDGVNTLAYSHKDIRIDEDDKINKVARMIKIYEDAKINNS